MHIDDLNQAVESGETGTIRQGFLILASWPDGGTIHGWDNVIDLADALENTSRALQWLGDLEAVPRQFVARLRRSAHGHDASTIGDSYESCAGYVLSNSSLFRGAFWQVKP